MKVTKGIRHSIVYYVHFDFLKDDTNDDDIEVNDNIISDLNNAQGINKLIKLTNPKKEQITKSFEYMNSRRNQKDVFRAQCDLKVEDFSDNE